ncbi:MAG: hypothetical protein IPP83_05295 [Flavobacteriales bacterium]|nr:hypothetical protein [Flavobacteriales bacterium]
MERREHYDPEDIENLLQERSYDELLEEERAYVLRHISGRAEYEAMRQLLGQVREDDRRREPITVEPEIRDHIMAAFRANQRPQWRVWLNSIGGLLWPKELSAMWKENRLLRPALAFASLALLIVAGVWMIQTATNNKESAQVAELKKEEPAKLKVAEPSVPATENQSVFEPAPPPTQQPAGSLKEVGTTAGATRSFNEVEMDAAPVSGNAQLLEVAADESVAEKKDGNLDERREGERARAPITTDVVTLQSAAGATQSGTHVVTEEELTMNTSVANATGKVTKAVLKEKAERTASVSTTLSANPELLALIGAGW